MLLTPELRTLRGTLPAFRHAAEEHPSCFQRAFLLEPIRCSAIRCSWSAAPGLRNAGSFQPAPLPAASLRCASVTSKPSPCPGKCDAGFRTGLQNWAALFLLVSLWSFLVHLLREVLRGKPALPGVGCGGEIALHPRRHSGNTGTISWVRAALE